MPIQKTAENIYEAILSDDSIDREDEIISKELLSKWASDIDGYLPALSDHNNKIEMLTAQWHSPKIVKSGNGNYGMHAKPQFFKSTPAGKMAKGLLDEGCKVMGVSIGAILKSSVTKTVNGKEVNVWTDAELVEASFVAVPANKHARAYAVIAKSFNLENKEEVIQEGILDEKLQEEDELDMVTEEKFNELLELVKANSESIKKTNESLLKKNEEIKVEDPAPEAPVAPVVEEPEPLEEKKGLILDRKALLKLLSDGESQKPATIKTVAVEKAVSLRFLTSGGRFE